MSSSLLRHARKRASVSVHNSGVSGAERSDKGKKVLVGADFASNEGAVCDNVKAVAGSEWFLDSADMMSEPVRGSSDRVWASLPSSRGDAKWLETLTLRLDAWGRRGGRRSEQPKSELTIN